MITDEMVDKAYNIWLSHVDAKKSLRAALEAVAPVLIAQELRRITGLKYVENNVSTEWLKARAQELDPK